MSAKAAVTPSRLLFDTCVWLDNYLGERHNSKAARELIDAALERDVLLLYAATSVKDVHHLVARSLKQLRRATGEELSEEGAYADNECAWACIQNMDEIATAVPLDGSDIWVARHYKAIHRDVEDNLVVAAAQRAEADILVTDDLDLIKHSPVAALAPQDALALLKAGRTR